MKNSLYIIRTITFLIFTLFVYSSGQFLNPFSGNPDENDSNLTAEISFICDQADDNPYFIEEDTEEYDQDFHRLASTIFFEKRIFETGTFSEYKNNENLPVVVLIQNTNLPPPPQS